MISTCHTCLCHNKGLCKNSTPGQVGGGRTDILGGKLLLGGGGDGVGVVVVVDR